MAFVRFVLFCADTVNDFLNKNCQYIAGAISFYTLFALFPLLLAVTSILGFVLGPRAEQSQIEMARSMAEVLPVSSEFISEAVEGVVRSRHITGLFSVVGLLWAATAAFGAIRKGINAAWGVNRPRPFLKERLIDFALVLGAGVVLLVVLFSSPAVGVLKEITSVLAPESEFFSAVIWDLITALLSPTMTFLTFLVLYRFLPNTDVRFHDVWLGALLASLAFEGAKWAFVWYVSSFAHYNVVYGSVGAILALLTWVYLSAIIVLFGALVTSRFAGYASSIPSERQSQKTFWTGFSRVRLRVVESSRAG